MLIYKGSNIRDKWAGKIRVLDIRRPILSSRAVSLSYASGKIGARAGRVSRDVGYIEVDIRILGDLSTRRGIARQMAAWLDDDDDQAISFTDEPALTYYGLLDGDTDFDESLKVSGDLTLVFVCPDPYAIGKSVSKTVPAGGLTIVNDGTADTFPRFTAAITATQSSITFTNQTTGKSVKVIRNLVAGDTVVVDCNTREILINGDDARPTLDLTSRFFPLQGGKSNIVKYVGTATVTVDYNERWK